MTEELERLRSVLAGSYTIERELGRGGMATVYLARDLRHGRAVAIKVLKPEVAAAVGADRFLREIRVTAALQHPHILPLYDSGAADGLLYYVMSFVEGESLRERLGRERQLPIEDAVRITREVASALDFAHRHGVVHRDVKPENILLQDGQALVADFGIAFAAGPGSSGRLTESGLTVGTPQYMSPEQAMGERQVSGRADIFSLGTILFEMLTGDPPFSGSTVAAIAAKVMTEPTPSVSTTRDTVPPTVAAALERALAKLPADRFSTAGAFSDALALPGVPTPVSLRTSSSGYRRSWLADWRSWLAIAAAGTATALWVSTLIRSGESIRGQVARLEVTFPPEAPLEVAARSPLTVSRDGRLLVYVAMARDSGGSLRNSVFVRHLDRLSPTRINLPEGAWSFDFAPFVSPDDRWVGYFLGGVLWKSATDGGSPVKLGSSKPGTYRPTGAWLDDGSILFTSAQGQLSRIPGEGQAAKAVFADSTWAILRLMPVPGNRRVVMVRCPVQSCDGHGEAAVLDLDTGTLTGLPSPDRVVGTWYVDPGWLVYLDETGSLLAGRFNPKRVGQSGPVVQLGDRPVARSSSLGPAFAVSRTGTAAILQNVGTTARNRLVFVNPDGTEQPIGDQKGDFLFPRLSPDGRRIALEVHDEAGGQIWVSDLGAGTMVRLTSEGHCSRPAWSPDGRTLAFTSMGPSAGGLYVVPADGSAPPRKVASLRRSTVPPAWSPDGRWIAFSEQDPDPTGPAKVAIVSPDGEGQPKRLFDSPGSETRPLFSPDGRWLAYVSDESGKDQIYLRRVDGSGGRIVISVDGGVQPAWGRDGRELFYIAPDGWMHSATLVFSSAVEVAGRKRLFDTAPYSLFGESSYDLSADGRRFLMVRAEPRDSKLILVLNWAGEMGLR